MNMQTTYDFPGFKDNVEVGSIYKNRAEVLEAGLHNNIQSGICARKNGTAFSIVIREKKGYVDDVDYGNIIIYTGQGGRDPKTLKQIQHQKLERGNKALVINFQEGLPVNVIRGYGDGPSSRYRYDGLFHIEDYWYSEGKDGFNVYRFRLVQSEDENINYDPIKKIYASGSEAPTRINYISKRIIRDTALSKEVKELYDFKCQICDFRIDVETGFYAEGAHIKGLGKPHNGPDTSDNILCLCPNHHVMFDRYTFTIANDLALIGIPGKLNVHKNHVINKDYLNYHRKLAYKKNI